MTYEHERGRVRVRFSEVDEHVEEELALAL